MTVLCCAESLSNIPLFVIPWTVAPPPPPQAPLSMEFSRHEYWSGLPCPPQWIFPAQRLNLGLSHCR